MRDASLSVIMLDMGPVATTTFQDWQRAVASLLPGMHPGVSLSDLDDMAMHAAWQQGESPVVFLKRSPLPVVVKKAAAAAADDGHAPSYLLIGFGWAWLLLRTGLLVAVAEDLGAFVISLIVTEIVLAGAIVPLFFSSKSTDRAQGSLLFGATLACWVAAVAYMILSVSLLAALRP
jgi:hypothetical protein